jgi:hypothetical protein
MFDKPITGRGEGFFDEVANVLGEDVADEVRLASLPIDERIRVHDHRIAEIDARLDELVDEYPALKSISPPNFDRRT